MKTLGCSLLLVLWACCGAEGKACDYPEIENGSLSDWHYGYFRNLYFPMTKGIKIFYKCDKGYAPKSGLGSSIITCTDQGWTPAPRCHQILCYYETVVNGEMLPRRDKYTLDDTVDLNCHPGFVALYSKDIKRTCTIKGWVPPLQCESVACDYPEIENGRLSHWYYRYHQNHSFPMAKGRQIDYECRSGYATESADVCGRIKCTDEGWSPTPRCRKILCYYETVVNGEMLPRWDNYTLDDTVDLNCHPGFVALYSKDIKRTCTIKGWVPPLQCESKTCDYPEIENGKLSSWSYRYFRIYFFPMTKGREIYYECDRGNVTGSGHGSSTIACTDEGWTPAPRCRTPPICSGPPSVPHGKVVGDVKNEYSFNSSIEYICDEGYVLRGARMLTCFNGEWSRDVPQCIRLCQVTEDKLKEHFVELSLKQRDKMAFFEGDEITFTCISGFQVHAPPGILVANCSKAGFIYPTCFNLSSCILEQKELDQKNIKLLPGFANLQYATNGQVIEFSCKEGYIKHTRSSDLSQICEEGFIAYPICIRART